MSAKFRQPWGWADRTAASLASRYSDTDSEWQFIGTCVSLGDGPLIDFITDDDRQEEMKLEEVREIGKPFTMQFKSEVSAKAVLPPPPLPPPFAPPCPARPSESLLMLIGYGRGEYKNRNQQFV